MMLNLVRRKLRRLGGILWRVRRGADKAIIHRVVPWIVSPHQHSLCLERLGSDYGGWYVPTDLIRSNWICYCVGVGADATFDMSLVDRFACQVYSFDPTPRAVAYMEHSQYDRARLHFLPWGVWSEDTELRFFEPANPRETMNLSVFDLHGTGRFVSAPCKRLSSIMRDLGHHRIDLLKLDVEGAWKEVLSSMIEDHVRVSVLCIELDSPVTLLRVLRVIKQMQKLGLQLVRWEKDNYVFVQHDLLSPAAASLAAQRVEIG